MSPYKVNCIFLPAAYHPAALLSLFILSSPPCRLIISSCPLMSLISSLFQSNFLLFSSSYITLSPRLSSPPLHSSAVHSLCPPFFSQSIIPFPLVSSIPSTHTPPICPPPPPPLPCRRLKYEETIKLRLISIWTGGRRATAETTTEPWKSIAELFLIPGMTFYCILLNETEQSSASPFRQSNYHQNKRPYKT